MKLTSRKSKVGFVHNHHLTHSRQRSGHDEPNQYRVVHLVLSKTLCFPSGAASEVNLRDSWRWASKAKLLLEAEFLVERDILKLPERNSWASGLCCLLCFQSSLMVKIHIDSHSHCLTLSVFCSEGEDHKAYSYIKEKRSGIWKYV